MAEETKLKKTRFCLNCERFFKCKGSIDVDTCINFIKRERKVENGDNTTNDKDDKA